MTTPEDKLGRVRTMVHDDGDTWDLSPNDKDALKHVLSMLDVAILQLAALSGNKIADTRQILHDAAERGEP